MMVPLPRSWKQVERVYFLGIGGIGMSALAQYMLRQGMEVYGYDKVRTGWCKTLEEQGMHIHYQDHPEHIPSDFVHNTQTTRVIYTPAIPSNSAELQHFEQHAVPMFKRAEVLGLLSKECYTIAIAGTHGKTTTTTMLAKVLYSAPVPFTAFLGGISADFESNLVVQTEGKPVTDKPIMLVEADEYDRSFLHLAPHIAVITSVDADHLDIYGDAHEVIRAFESFAQCITPQGHLIVEQKAQIKVPQHVCSYQYGSHASHFNFSQPPQWATQNRFYFTAKPNLPVECTLGMRGQHNMLNATAVLAVAHILGITMQNCQQALQQFKGIKRRFQVHYESEKAVLIDDYAHHPTEIKALIDSVKALYPQRPVTGVFQPHLYSRTRDFLDSFASSLSQLDTCYIAPIYAAREQPIEGINAHTLASQIPSCKGVFEPAQLVQLLGSNPPPLLLILGAGDIDLIIPQILKQWQA